MKDDLHFLQLWDMYSPLLTATQREITDLYFNYDLSLGEIAEQKNVSRQSVSDCLHKCRKQLESYEEKLGLLKSMQDISREYSAYATTVERWLENNSAFTKAQELKADLEEVRKEFQIEQIDLGEGNVVYGKTYRKEE